VQLQALHALQQLSVCGLPSLASPQHHLQQLGRFLDLGQPALAGALGALVAVLLRVSEALHPGPQSYGHNRALLFRCRSPPRPLACVPAAAW
jgi:hypothetical protein